MDYTCIVTDRTLGLFLWTSCGVAGRQMNCRAATWFGVRGWLPGHRWIRCCRRADERRIGAQPPPIPAAALKPKSNRLLIGLLVTAGVVVFVAFAGFIASKFVQGFRRGLQASRRTAPSEAVDVASKPVSTLTNSLTEEAVRKRAREFRVRQYVDGYRKNGQHTAAWDREASQLMESWIAFNYGGPTNPPAAQA